MSKFLKVFVGLSAMALVIAMLLAPASANAKRGGQGGRGDGPTIYVTGQGLVYDSIVTADPLPMKGRFQKLELGGPTGLQTEFGPGDQGYVGGRWWLDLNGNGEMDPAGENGDKYFSCPLQGPGHDPTP
jgi:hypothetical protein